jgi:hypothetical protein
MGCQAVTNLETQKHLLSHHRAKKGKAGFLLAPVLLAFRHYLPALINKVTTAGNRPVGSIK